MSYFLGNDLKLIEALVYNPSLEPSFDVMRDALVWDDERPDGLSREGYEKLCDLWIVRSLIHRGISFTDWPLDPEYFGTVWSQAQKQGFKWPGFNRLHLSQKDREYYEKSLHDLRESNEI